MSAVDRTQEFVDLAEQLSSSSRKLPVGSSRVSGYPQQQSHHHGGDGQFNLQTADIGACIDKAVAKLKGLNGLVRQRGIFNDKTSEIQELSFDVKTAITTLNGRLETLERNAGSSGAIGSHYQAHHTNVIETLKSRLLELTKDFKDTLQIRAESMKQQDNRRNMYSFSGPTGSSSKTPSTSQYSFNVSTATNYDVESGGQQSAQVMQERGGMYHQSRAEAVESVHRMISELAQMFQKVAALVHQQDEMVQRIDENVDSSLHNVRQGQSELLKYYNIISSNRSLIIKVFLMLMLFIGFFIVFLA